MAKLGSCVHEFDSPTELHGTGKGQFSNRRGAGHTRMLAVLAILLYGSVHRSLPQATFPSPPPRGPQPPHSKLQILLRLSDTIVWEQLEAGTRVYLFICDPRPSFLTGAVEGTLLVAYPASISPSSSDLCCVPPRLPTALGLVGKLTPFSWRVV